MDYPTDPALRMHPSTGKWTDGNSGAGVPASIDSGEQNNQVWDELINLISAAGLTPNDGNLTQVSSAVSGLIAAAVNGLAAINSPTFTGTPAAPTPGGGTNNTQIATTAFVQALVAVAVNGLAALNSPNFSGVPTAPTPGPSTNSAQIASTNFVQTKINELIDSAPGLLDTFDEIAAALGDNPNLATDLTNLINTKANNSSPGLTGNPTAPTQTAGNNSTRLATTAFVSAAISALSSVYASAGHNHNGLYAALAHTHAQGEVVGLVSALAEKIGITGYSSDDGTAGHLKLPDVLGGFIFNWFLTGSIPDGGNSGFIGFDLAFTTRMLGCWANPNDSGFARSYNCIASTISAQVNHWDNSGGAPSQYHVVALGK